MVNRAFYKRNPCNTVIRNEKRLFDQQIRTKIKRNSGNKKYFWTLESAIYKNFRKSNIPILVDSTG